MKKLLLSAALVAAACAPAAADDYNFMISTHCENNQPVDFANVEEGKTYEIEPETLFGMMYECAAYIKLENNSSEEIKCDITLTKVHDNCDFAGYDVKFQTCLGGSCQSGDLSLTVPAGSATPGGYGEHIGYSLMVRDGVDTSAIKFDAKYDVVVKIGSSYTRNFTLEFKSDTNAVDSVEVAGAEAVYYNLQGMPVNEPVAGQMYIVRQGSKVTKVIR